MDMSKVAIVAALEREVRPLVKEWRVTEKEYAGKRFRFFEERDEIVLVCGGIGAEAARRAAEAVITIYAPTVVYSAGFCGALDPGLKAGDVVCPAQVINAQDGSRVTLRGGNGVLVSFGSVATPAQKARLKESFGAQVVDMEAAAVARAAQARDVEFAAVKAVSDEFDFMFPAMEQFVDSAGGFHQVRFAAYAAVRPWLWPKVRRLAINSNLASLALRDWLATSMNRMVASAPDKKLEATHRS
jgi:adenosylhomocysteine nucleosidase